MIKLGVILKCVASVYEIVELVLNAGIWRLLMDSEFPWTNSSGHFLRVNYHGQKR